MSSMDDITANEDAADPLGLSNPMRIGRYEIEAELGRGAMGIVYRANDPVLTRKVAIKTILLSPDPDERQEYETRFFTEAKAAGGLSHPNIITIYDLGHEGDVAYMAMELLEGRELRNVLDSEQIPLLSALEYAVQMAQGIAYAHDRGVIHRDLKPANIMIVGTEDAQGGQVKIMDFGIARLTSAQSRTRTGLMLGSPKYMAPEQIAGKKLDHRCDIFSLGVMLYEMVTGFAPFNAEQVNQIMYQVGNVDPRPPSQVNRSAPAMLDLIVAKALAKDPANRYGDAHQLLADLLACKAEVEANPVDDLASRSMRQVIGPAPGLREAQGDKAGAAAADLRASIPPARPLGHEFASPEGAHRFTVSRKYDSAEALACLDQKAPAAGRMAPGRLRLLLVYALAVLVAALIVFL
jgi:eukaryotic-like serine/threonine-protein kinase